MDLNHHLLLQEGTSFLKVFSFKFILVAVLQIFEARILHFCFLCVSTVSHLMNHGRTSASLYPQVGCYLFQVLFYLFCIPNSAYTNNYDLSMSKLRVLTALKLIMNGMFIQPVFLVLPVFTLPGSVLCSKKQVGFQPLWSLALDSHK